MKDAEALTYHYDGSFDGMLCCAYESVYGHELPDRIVCGAIEQMTLFGYKEIVTDQKKADRVRRSIPKKISDDALDFVQRVYLCCHPQKERDILLFLYLGYQKGAKVLQMLSHPVVSRLDKAVRQLGSEAHKLCGFIRFSVVDDVMFATISPKNFVLPLLASHFVFRFPGECFMIYDDTHQAALLYEDGQMDIRNVSNIQPKEADEEEREYRRLWQMYYHTMAIKERYNPTCRRTMMPKRYWHNMTEFASGRLGAGRELSISQTNLKELNK